MVATNAQRLMLALCTLIDQIELCLRPSLIWVLVIDSIIAVIPFSFYLECIPLPDPQARVPVSPRAFPHPGRFLRWLPGYGRHIVPQKKTEHTDPRRDLRVTLGRGLWYGG